MYDPIKRKMIIHKLLLAIVLHSFIPLIAFTQVTERFLLTKKNSIEALKTASITDWVDVDMVRYNPDGAYIHGMYIEAA